MRYFVVVHMSPLSQSFLFPLSVLVLHYWSNARIFHFGYIEPFQQPNRCYCSFKLQFNVCSNKVVIGANISAPLL